jgi:hypothetical protein
VAAGPATASCSENLSRDRSKTLFIPSTISVKLWRDTLPSVSMARPSHCPDCGIASRVVGERLRIHGHGVRGRQQRGPRALEKAPDIIEVTQRRYRCMRCNAVCVVGPCDIVPRYLYGYSAIALAFALFGLLKLPVGSVRQRLCPWRRVGACAYGRWTTLRRWLAAIREQRLALAPNHDYSGSDRNLASRIASVIAAQAPPQFVQRPQYERAFFGAVPASLLATA